VGLWLRLGEKECTQNLVIKRKFGRQRSGWENNIKIDLRKMSYHDYAQMELALDRFQWRTFRIIRVGPSSSTTIALIRPRAWVLERRIFYFYPIFLI
jgi:hypothetical protein